MRRAHAVLLAAALVVANLLALPAAAAQGERVAGPSRVETAAAIARRAFPDGAGRVFLARADVLADALSAGTLTTGPVLLVPSCGPVPRAVRDAITALAPETVSALGGTGAVCDELLAGAAAGRGSSRLAGASRVETAVRVAQAAFPSGSPEVYLARPDDGPDAVAGGSLPNGPILLVPREGPVPPAVLAEIERLDPRRVTALGGTAALPDEVVDEAAAGLPQRRIAGASRLETAVAISRSVFGVASDLGRPASTVYLARADKFSDAVAAGALTDGPVVLVPPCAEALPPEVADELQRLEPERVVALGGDEAVCDRLLEAAAAVEPDPVEIPATTQVLDEDARTNLVAATPEELRFDGDVGLQPGDVVVSEPTDAAPDGLLRRVLGVREVDGQTVVATEQAALGDAITSGRVTASADLDFEDIESSRVLVPGVEVRGGDGTTLQDVGTEISVDFANSVVLFDADGSPTTTDDQVTASGAVVLGLGVEVDVAVSVFPPGVDRFVVGIDATEQVDIGLMAAANASIEQEVTIYRAEFAPITVPIGPVPVVVSPELELKLTASGEVSAGLSFGVVQTGSFRAGAEYTDGDWRTLSGYDADFTVGTPELDVTADARAGAPIEVKVELYEAAGPEIIAEPYTRAEAEVVPEAAFRLYGGIEARVSGEVELPIIGGFELPELTVLDYERELLAFPEPGGSRPGSSDVRATLIWSGDSDMDLHVVDPAGEEIFFADRTSTSGGQLDIDDIPVCGAETGQHIENIFWPPMASPAGGYAAFIHHYNSCADAPSDYVLEVRVDGQLVQRDTGTLAEFAESDPIAFDAGGSQVLYHYTSEAGLEGILTDGQINPSSGPRNARYGDGVYTTDITTADTSSRTPGQLSLAIYNDTRRTRTVTHFVAIDTEGLDPQEVAPVYTTTFGARSILYNATTTPLPIGDRVVDSGITPFVR